MRVTTYLVGALPGEAWFAEPAGDEGRTIAAVVAHMHGLRCSIAKAAGGEDLGPRLDPKASTPAEAVEALDRSRETPADLFECALAGGRGRIEGLPRRVVDMMAYLIQHDAHHRGQIVRQARELGHRASEEDVMRVWKKPPPREDAPAS